MTDFSIGPESPVAPDILGLMAESDLYHAALYPSESNHLLAPAAFLGDDRLFLVGRMAGVAVITGALILMRDDRPTWGEIKRMFLSPTMRGRGLGRAMLTALEATARRRGLACLRLETGIYQPEAIALYRKAGYQSIAAFGHYVDDPLSLFMEKTL